MMPRRDNVCSEDDSQDVLEKLQNLNIDSRLKNTLRKFGTGVRSTSSFMNPFKGLLDSECPFCQQKEELEIHLMLKCDLVRALWFRMMGISLDSLQVTSPKDFLVALIDGNPYLYDNGDTETRRRVCTFAAILFKRLWEACDQAVRKNVRVDVERLCQKISNDMVDEENRSNRSRIEESVISWPPPFENYLPLNVDDVWTDMDSFKPLNNKI